MKTTITYYCLHAFMSVLLLHHGSSELLNHKDPKLFQSFSADYSAEYSTDYSIVFSYDNDYSTQIIFSADYSSQYSSSVPTCTDYDQSYCNDMGYCLSGECICYDNLHYWSAERCSTYHDGRELEEGMCCYPDTVDYYCSWLGKCDSTGTYCECFDNEHRTTADRCLNWYAEIPSDASSTCFVPTMAPTVRPTTPTTLPTNRPSTAPITSNEPSLSPTNLPTNAPTTLPSVSPTDLPTTVPSVTPSREPTSLPSVSPTDEPSTAPSVSPSRQPVSISTYIPSVSPTKSPTRTPSKSPTVRPTAIPTFNPTPTSAVCAAYDREYCNNRGYCNADGTSCECDDISHYWPSERCEYYHEGRELQDGWYCYPDTVDSYCSWLGICSSDGNMCECFDSTHRSSNDRCASYIGSAPTPAPGTTGDSCTPNDRGYCYNGGYCNSAGNGCVCDDTLHYWPSEQCSTYHHGPELEQGMCCVPNSEDYYCSWLGVCNSNGTACECYDSEHRLPSERCATYHYDLSVVNVTNTSGVCPELPLLVSSSGDTSSNGGSDNTLKHYELYIIIACAVVAIVLIVISIAIYKNRENKEYAFEKKPLEYKCSQQRSPTGSIFLEVFDGKKFVDDSKGNFQMVSPISSPHQQLVINSEAQGLVVYDDEYDSAVDVSNTNNSNNNNVNDFEMIKLSFPEETESIFRL